MEQLFSSSRFIQRMLDGAGLLSSFSFPLPEEVWTVAFNELGQRIRHFFVRPEPYQRALACVRGLMSPAERKNGWQVAEEVGEVTPYATQHLLDRAKWAWMSTKSVPGTVGIVA